MTVERVVVVVPARDEARRLAVSLGALVRAARRCPVPVRITVVDDGSRDRTRELARDVLGTGHRVVPGPATDVGDARRVGVEAAAEGIAVAERTWVASTDADTVVPPDWLVRHVAHAAAGADALAGVVRVAGAGGRVAGAFSQRYGRATAGPHPHLHAANLGVRLSTLDAAGSWRSASHAEDHDLWSRLPREATVVADAAVVVATSGRRVGRAPIGFAADVDRLARAAVAGPRPDRSGRA